MAQSVKTDFSLWSQFDHHAYEIMTEGFVHDNLLKINTNIMSAKGRVRLQETLMQRVNSLRTTGQANIWFPLISNKSLYFQLRTKGFKIHFDNGLFARGHLLHNLYASLQSNRKLDDYLLKLGCETVAQNWRYNIRYKYSTQDQSHTCYSKWRCDYKNWTFEGLEAFDFNNLILLKNNILFGYYIDNKTFHLRLQNEEWRSHPINLKNIRLADVFDYATFNFTRTINANQRIGIQSGIKANGQLKPFSIVWEGYDPIFHRNLKLKASSNHTAALSLRNKIGTYGNYILGIGVNSIGSRNNVHFGLLVDLNL